MEKKINSAPQSSRDTYITVLRDVNWFHIECNSVLYSWCEGQFYCRKTECIILMNGIHWMSVSSIFLFTFKLVVLFCLVTLQEHCKIHSCTAPSFKIHFFHLLQWCLCVSYLRSTHEILTIHHVSITKHLVNLCINKNERNNLKIEEVI